MFSRLANQTGMLLAAFLLIYLGLAALPPIPALRNIDSYLMLHTSMETFSVVVSCMIFGIVWNSDDSARSRNVLVLGAAFLAIGLLDFGHMMAYKGMPDFVTPSSPQKGIVFWLSARLVAASALLYAALASWRPFAVSSSRWICLAPVLLLSALVYWGVLWHPQQMPIFWDSEHGLTHAKLVVEYTLMAMYAAAAVLFYRKLKQPDGFDCQGLFLAACILVISELCFTSYSSVTDAFNFLGHIYKVAAYVFLYHALFVQMVRDPYQKLATSRHEIWLEKERAEVTLQSIMDGVIKTDAAGNITAMNPIAWQLTGWSLEAAYGQPISKVFNVFNETDHSPIENPVEKCLREKSAVLLSNHAMVVSQFGTAYAIEQLASPIIDRSGGIIGVVLVFRDVTQRRYAQNEIERKGQQLREAQAIAHVGSWEWSAESGHIEWSDELYRIFGYEPGSVAPSISLFLDRLHPDDHVRMLASVGRALIEDYTEVKEYRLLLPDGQLRYLSARRRIDRDPEGRPVRMMGTMQDITTQKQSEILLRNAKEEIEDLYEYAPCGYHSLDTDGVILRINQTELDWLGYQRDEVVGKMRFVDLLAPAGIKLFHENYSRFKECGEVRALEYEMVRKDGTLLYGLLNATAIYDQNGNYVASRSSITDITARKQLENEVRSLNAGLEQRVAERTAQLEAANRELEAFSYSVSHDLRAPLRSIDGFSQMLESDCANMLDEQGHYYIERLRAASQRMNELIDDLLELSRVSRTEIHRTSVDLSRMATEVLTTLAAAEPQRSVTREVAPGMDVQGDPKLLKIALENLVSNAWKFTREQASAHIEIGVRQQGADTVYYVRDNGVGFNQKYAHKLFGAFQRLHGEDEFEGTGIGLATVQRIIARHGGKIWATGELGGGAEFCFTLEPDYQEG